MALLSADRSPAHHRRRFAHAATLPRQACELSFWRSQNLKTFLSCKSFPLHPFFFFFGTDYMIPQTFTVTSEHIRLYFLVFLFLHFLVVVSVR